jgi:ERCC4-related helicase
MTSVDVASNICRALLSGADVPFENITRMGMTRQEKDAALASFRRDPNVSVLLLNRAAAEGLDLSFVSRIFVMEPLDNASLEQQVRQCVRVFRRRLR